MNFINNLERKLGRFAVPNLIIYIIGAQLLGYVINLISPMALLYMTLEPYYIIKNFQIWRLITWIMIPHSTSLFFMLIMMFLYYQLGQALERTWGVFRFNLYIWGGILFTIIGAFLLYGYFALQGRYISTGTGISTYYINLAIFLAFATCFPNMEVMLYFIIPIKMKYMAILYGIMVIYDFINSNTTGRVTIVMSLLNFIIFFFSTRDLRRINPKEIKRKRDYRRGVNSGYRQNPKGPKVVKFPGGAKGVITKHKCAICGRTELDDPTLEFRFCSKCEGNYEYCSDHLYTHQHIKRD
ncbi:MAG: hypothetical protein K6E13_11420 [Lachnospiraceae bacterium]|nr:hypothetical protein [Lachnospiraceae bacterium]